VAGNGASSLYAAVQAIDPRLEALDNFANATHFVEFRLQLVDFAQNGPKARDFLVGHLNCVTRAVVLHLGCCLCLLRELIDTLAPSPSHCRSISHGIGHLRGNSHSAIAAGSSTSDGQSGR
jgi:hypothetical protein